MVEQPLDLVALPSSVGVLEVFLACVVSSLCSGRCGDLGRLSGPEPSWNILLGTDKHPDRKVVGLGGFDSEADEVLDVGAPVFRKQLCRELAILVREHVGVEHGLAGQLAIKQRD